MSGKINIEADEVSGLKRNEIFRLQSACLKEVRRMCAEEGIPLNKDGGKI